MIQEGRLAPYNHLGLYCDRRQTHRTVLVQKSLAYREQVLFLCSEVEAAFRLPLESSGSRKTPGSGKTPREALPSCPAIKSWWVGGWWMRMWKIHECI